MQKSTKFNFPINKHVNSKYRCMFHLVKILCKVQESLNFLVDSNNNKREAKMFLYFELLFKDVKYCYLMKG